MGGEERSANAQAKGWSGEGQRSVAAVAEKRSDGCDGADDGSDEVQDAMADEDARTRLFRGRRRRQRKPYTERTAPRRRRTDPPTRACIARRRHCWESWNQLRRVPVPRILNELTWPKLDA
eukprot:gene13677-biopygen3561